MSSLDTTPHNQKDGLWKSLEELENPLHPTPEHTSQSLHLHSILNEFPQGAALWQELENPLNRRHFLQLLGASTALAGITACTKMPAEKIIPYITTPETFVPGKPQYFATACSFEGYAKGILAESHEGRPTKLEGNSRHPLQFGKSDLFTQAELLQLYDP